MKIFNLKIDIKRILLSFLIIFLILFIIWIVWNNQEIKMNNTNFTSILRDSHQDINKFIGKRITTSGYIFRCKDFAEENFVIARDMLISETEANIVGFLCSYEFANDFENNEWVEATGRIILGDYHGPIPIIQIDSIHKITTPNDAFVSMPK